jgi:hypothetical protein
MTRRLLNLATAVSLLLCVAVCVLWVRAQFVMDQLVVNSTRNYVELNGRRGGVWVLWIREPRDGPLWVSLEHDSRPPYPLVVRPYSWRHRIGLTIDRRIRAGVSPGVDTWVTLPYWFLAGLAAVAPSLRLRQLRRRRCQRGKGLCPACGYDLRATPERCPECGAASLPCHAGS